MLVKTIENYVIDNNYVIKTMLTIYDTNTNPPSPTPPPTPHPPKKLSCTSGKDGNIRFFKVHPDFFGPLLLDGAN